MQSDRRRRIAIFLLGALLLHTLPVSGYEPGILRDSAPASPCEDPCLARVPVGIAAPVLWAHGAVSYALADTALLGDFQRKGMPLTVIRADTNTLPLYAMFGVRADQDDLVRTYGAIVDSVGDVRLVAATALPLRVTALTSAGIHVEKMLPACAPAIPATLPTFALDGTLREIVAIGASDATPLGDREYDGVGAPMAAAYLACRFATLGYVVSFEGFTDWQGHPQTNVVALPPGAQIGPAMTLITAHDDSISPVGMSAPGADDDASGVAAMLSLADRESRGGFRHAVGFVAFAAEEPGLLGSGVFARRLAEAHTDLGSVINLDAIGVGNGGRVYVNGNGASYRLFTELAQLAANGPALQWMYSPGPISDDEALRSYGYTAIMLTTHPYGTSPLHHTERDLVANLDLPQIEWIVDLVWRWITAMPQ